MFKRCQPGNRRCSKDPSDSQRSLSTDEGFPPDPVMPWGSAGAPGGRRTLLESDRPRHPARGPASGGDRLGPRRPAEAPSAWHGSPQRVAIHAAADSYEPPAADPSAESKLLLAAFRMRRTPAPMSARSRSICAETIILASLVCGVMSPKPTVENTEIVK